MRSIVPDGKLSLRGWLKPFLEQLGHKARRRMGPLQVAPSHLVPLGVTAHRAPTRGADNNGLRLFSSVPFRW